MTKILIDRAVVEQALHVATAAGYPVALIAALRAALAEPFVDDPHRDHWIAIAEAAQKIAASKECGLMEAKALCAALDRLTDAALAEPVQEPATLPGPGLVMCPACCSQFDPALNRVEPVPDPDSPERRCGGPGCDMRCCQPVQEPVACFIGTKGSAFDSPTTKRAYTYAEQPGNVVASRLGFACNAAASQSAGDSIDRGLGLLQELQRQGFGVFDLGAEYAAPPQRPAQPVQEPVAKCIDDICSEHLGRVEALDYLPRGTILFTTPPQRKPLTDEQKQAIHNETGAGHSLICLVESYINGIKE